MTFIAFRTHADAAKFQKAFQANCTEKSYTYLYCRIIIYNITVQVVVGVLLRGKRKQNNTVQTVQKRFVHMTRFTQRAIIATSN